MNQWNCDEPGCSSTAIGVGGAVRLRAIGWWFKPGPSTYCPRHRPDRKEITLGRYLDCTEDDCSLCHATEEAEHWQWLMQLWRKE